MDRTDRELPGAHPLQDQRSLRLAPRRLADREQGECARLGEVLDREIAHVVDAPPAQPVHLGDLLHPDCGLIEHPVDTGRTVVVRRDLGDEQQRADHAAAK